MQQFQLFANPWWVNLVLLIPIASFAWWRKHRLELSTRTLIISGLFGLSFGFVEAAAVVYLSAALGILGDRTAISAIAGTATNLILPEALLSPMAKKLMTIEVAREAATLVMLMSIAMLAAKTRRERWAVFLWAFALWDLMYYGGLWATIRWPQSLLTPDVLFLIPVPWIAQVWFPYLVSGLTLAAVLAARKSEKIVS